MGELLITRLNTKSPHPSRYIPIIIAGISGLCLSLFLFFMVGSWIDKELEIEFKSIARGYAGTIENKLGEYLSTSEFLKDHINISKDFDRKTFSLFANPILDRYPGIQALSWNPLVFDAEREYYESSVRSEGFDDFQFTQRSENGQLIRAEKRDEYVVVFMIEPLEKNRPALGFDIASNPVRLAAIQKAFDTGKAVATGKITLVQETGNQFGALILNPVFHEEYFRQKKGSTQKTGLSKQRKGLAVEVIRIGDAVESALTQFTDTDIELHLFDITTTKKGDLLFKRSRTKKSNPSLPVDIKSLEKSLHLGVDLDFATRDWRLIVSPSTIFLQNHTRYTDWIVLITGIGLTLLLVGYLFNRTTYIEEIEKRIQSETDMKNALEKSEAFLRTIYHNSEVGIFVVKVDGPGRYIYEGINQTHERLFGIKNEEIVGRSPKHLANFFDSELVTFVYGIYDSCVTTQKTYVSEDALTLKNGKTEWWLTRVTPIINENGDVYRLIGSAINITERKDSEHALVEKSREEEKLRVMLESLWHIASMGSESLKTICDYAMEEIEKFTESQYSFIGFLNPEQTRMTIYSWSSEAMADCRIQDKPKIFPISEAGVWARAVRERKSMIINNYHAPHKGKLGLPKGHVDITRIMTVPVMGSQGIEAVAAVANKQTDYTQEDETQVKAFISNLMILVRQKQAENDKEDLEIQLRQLQKSEAIGTLAGGIAHDFNNILFPITGFAELIKEDIEQDSPLNECVDEILIGAKRARELVMQILTFSRQTEEELKPLKPHLIIKEAVKLASATIPTTIEIRTQIEPDPMTIVADPTQIHQVIMNLITNAYHAMQESGGTLSITLKNITFQGSLHIDRLDAGPYILISVTDTGTGMDKTVSDKIFDPYFSTKPKDKGTGLGLSVVHGIIKSCGGEILVDSHLGKGTRFDIYLPAFESDVTIEEADEIQGTMEGTEKILLVDDESVVLNLEKKILTRLGYDVDTASNGIDAFEKIESGHSTYDLVITDMTMPKMTGDILAQKIKDIHPDMPVIICTGFSEKITPERAADIGISDLLTKPIILKKLARSIRKTLDKPV